MAEQGSIRHAFENALSLIDDNRPDLAAQQLKEILDEDPAEVNSLRLLGTLHLANGDTDGAIEHLSLAVRHGPNFDQAAIDLGRAYRQSGQHQAAVKLLQDLCHRKPNIAEAWQLMGDALIEHGDVTAGRDAFRRAAQLDPFRVQIAEGVRHLGRHRRRDAEVAFREVLKKDPNHIHALVGLATIATDAGAIDDAEKLLRHGLKFAPNMDPLWRGMARVHSQHADYEAAVAAAERAVELAPGTPDCWTMLGTVQAWGLNPKAAKCAFEKSLALNPKQPRVLLSLGHVLKTIGDRKASEEAYRRAVKMDPLMGEAYWSLADLKNYTFSDEEIDRVYAAIEDDRVTPPDRAAFNFALGKAYEDRKEYGKAFEHYAAGNAIKHDHEKFNSAEFKLKCERIQATITADFISSRRASHTSPVVPIFIIGMPRAGSTLLEQILASHARVQGTMELPHILNYVREFNADDRYPEALAEVSATEFAKLGARFIRETKPYRGTATYFIDKMPNNFSHIGFIRMMLPQAVFIDARRHPMDCCFSIFKQNFARGQTFSYDLTTLGGFYNDYLTIMRHWDEVMPGSVLRVLYEDIVDDTETQIRRLLDHCGLKFEAACLRFYETERAVRTASAEQVRQPIYRNSIEHWRHFEKSLAPLEQALGSALTTYKT